MSKTMKQSERGIEAPPGFVVPQIVNDLTRRDFLLGGAAAMLLGGCGGGGSEEADSSGGTRTLEHKYGSTEIEGEPGRVVSIGYNDHDFLYALGMSPVAARWWYGPKDDVIYPWAEDDAGDADPEILNMPEGLNFERIAALEPDLIVGVYSGMTEDDFGTLSEIAPTVAQSADFIDYGMPWDETTMLLGRAVGREGRAEELVAGLEGRFEEIRESHPEFEGKSLSVSTYRGDDVFSVFASEDARARFFTSLGFVIPEEFSELAGDSFFSDVSTERASDLLDVDVVVWDQIAFTEGGRETIENDPLIARLDAMEEGRVVFLEGDVENSFGWQTILSLPFALDEIVPMLEGAVEGTGEETTDGGGG